MPPRVLKFLLDLEEKKDWIPFTENEDDLPYVVSCLIEGIGDLMSGILGEKEEDQLIDKMNEQVERIQALWEDEEEGNGSSEELQVEFERFQDESGEASFPDFCPN